MSKSICSQSGMIKISGSRVHRNGGTVNKRGVACGVGRGEEKFFTMPYAPRPTPRYLRSLHTYAEASEARSGLLLNVGVAGDSVVARTVGLADWLCRTVWRGELLPMLQIHVPLGQRAVVRPHSVVRSADDQKGCKKSAGGDDEKWIRTGILLHGVFYGHRISFCCESIDSVS